MGRQHQGMDRPGVRQVPEGSREQGKMEETGCEIICGAPTTLTVKGEMMMIMTNVQWHTHFAMTAAQHQILPMYAVLLCLPIRV